MKKIVVIDGQGGGIGRTIVEKIKRDIKGEYSLIALGTNSMATVAMIRAGADEGATGENAILFNCRDADIITGPIGIIVANSMLGEFSENMVNGVTESRAVKVLIPINKCGIEVVGGGGESLPLLVDKAVKRIGELTG